MKALALMFFFLTGMALSPWTVREIKYQVNAYRQPGTYRPPRLWGGLTPEDAAWLESRMEAMEDEER